MSLSRRDLAFGFSAMAALAAAPAALAQSRLSAEDQAALNRAQQSLQSMSSVSGTFVETGTGGIQRRGQFWLQRPGKARFDYAAPAGMWLVSDGATVKQWDPRTRTLRQTQLARTALAPLLAQTIQVDQGVRIDRVQRTQNGGVTITARNARQPNAGALTLAFGGSPLRLTEWTLVESNGDFRRVQFTSMRSSAAQGAAFFQKADPRQQRRG